MELNRYKDRYAKEHQKVNLKDVFNNIKYNNISQKKEDRKGIVYATTSTQGRKHEHIEKFTGLIFIDVDNCEEASKVKNLFKQIAHTKATWYSTSGNVHALLTIPICKTVEEFKRRYTSLANDIIPLLKGNGQLDTITSNPTQLAFESYDKDIFIRETPEPYTQIEKKKRKRIIKANQFEPTTKREEWVMNWIANSINKINTNGYPQLLKLANTLGGYSSGGYISYNNALETLKTAISNNEYFNSNLSSGTMKVYQESGKASFENGMNTPINWEYNV